jgi:hypothetical protein
MGKRLVSIIVCLLLLVLIAACKKKEQTTAKPAGVAPQIIVPDSVKGKWAGVKITVSDKTKGKSFEITAKLDSESKILNSDLKIKVGEFLPDYKMEGLTITSASNEPNNPAVGIIVFEGEKEIFKGWLYSKFPNSNPFQHERYGLILKEGIKKL